MTRRADDNQTAAPTRREFLRTSAALAAAGVATGHTDAAAAPTIGKPFSGTPELHDVIIVGSGFGATVAASQLAGHVDSILVLERGVFFTSPERPLPPYLEQQPRHHTQYWPTPDNDTGLRESYLKTVRVHRGGRFHANKNKLPLYIYSQFKNVDVLTASGVGGGSLIYSNVSLEPYRKDDQSECPIMSQWPLKLSRAEYARAEDWMTRLRGVPSPIVTTVPLSAAIKDGDPDKNNPNILHLEAATVGNATIDYSHLYLPRSKALKVAASRLKNQSDIVHPWEPLKLQVFEHETTTAADMRDQRFCERQGRCFLGCLPGARHTLNKTFFKQLGQYLDPNASKKIKMRPLQNVRYVKRGQWQGKDYWDVSFHDVISGDEYIARAPVVILAAGVLGSVEVLMRSQQEGLSLSGAIGQGFSTNGDFSGFVVDIPKVLTDPALPKRRIDNRVFPTRGPINTSHVTFQINGRLINVEDAGIPPMFAAFTKRILKSINSHGFNFFEFIAQLFNHKTEIQTEPEMIEDVFWFNCMGDDGVPGKKFREFGGKFSFSGDRLSLDYTPKDHPVFAATEGLFKQFATAMDSDNKLDKSVTPRYQPFPLWGGILGTPKVVVTHPLGGCPMATTAEEGVVDTDGRVFSGASGADAHPGLFILDGSVVPGPVAVNPTLTIVAIALHIMDAVVKSLRAAGRYT